jgi:hypothetical protein
VEARAVVYVPVAVLERRFIHVAVQVARADAVVYAEDPALEQGEEAFDGVGVRVVPSSS